MSASVYLVSFLSLFYITLSLLVFFRNPKSSTNRLFLLFVLFVVIWLISNFLENAVSGQGLAAFFLQTDFASAILLAYFFLLFCQSFPASKKITLLSVLLFIPAIFLSVLSFFKDMIITNVSLNTNGIHFDTGIIFLPYALAVVGYMSAGMIELLRRYRASKGVVRIQILYVLLGFLISASIALVTNLILPQSFNLPVEIGRIGIYGLSFFIVFTAYAIVKHRLMDIRLIVVKSIIYALLFLFIGVIYTFFIFIIGSFVLQGFTGLEAYWAAMAVAIVVAFTFQPIRNIFTRWTDRVFFKGQYNFEELTSHLNEVATSTIILPELLFKFLNTLIEEMRITRGAFILLEEGKVYETESVGYKQAIQLDEAELKHLIKEKRTEVFDEVPEGSKCKEIMRKYDASLILTLQTEGEVIGFILLGEKKSGDIYSDKDIRVLEIITSSLALGVQNAKAYEKTQKFNLILRAEINRATKELRDVNQRLVNADKAKDEFISMASHEIRTPIATLEGYLSMLNNQKLRTQEISEISKRSYESVERLSTLVKDLLDVSRIEQKRIKIQKQSTRLERLIEQTMEGFQLQVQDKGIYLKFQKPEKLLPEVKVDPDRISEVLNNLIGNAIKFTEKGGITVSLAQKDGKALISVADTGIGINKDALPHLFKKFYQAQAASSTLSTERGGTGLGLYITKNIVELHGGEIWVESERRKGATFYFTLPL